jgi:hypothetical protein
MNAVLGAWRSLGQRTRNLIVNLVKLGITVGAFYMLLNFPVGADSASGREAEPVWKAIYHYIDAVEPLPFIMWSLAGMGIKFLGVIASAYGWSLLLQGQGLVFPFWQQTMTAFLIGRFIGTFLPSTIGLDAYTLYEAGRYSNEWHRTIIAKALEKFIGIAGLFTGILLTLPAGYFVLVDVVGDRALIVTAAIATVCGGITGAVVIGLVFPRFLLVVVARVGGILPGAVRHHVERFAEAATAYEGKVGLLLTALLVKFASHFSTAVVYYFTALAIGVTGVTFLPVVFGSLIQILGTLFSPTIAGEGAREAVQALLLSNHLGGVAQAVLSAALGFVAAEAATMWGGVFLWTRNASWRPTYMLVDGKQVDYEWINPDDDDGFDAEKIAAKTREASS